MSARKQIFLSEQQRVNFLSLSRAWGDSHRVFYRLPFEAVFDLGDVTDKVFRKALESALIPYTLCDLDGAPRLCVEFDELGEGVSIADDYSPTLPTDIAWGRLVQLKLAVARGSSFPYVVVSSMYFKALSKETEFSIIDGIIGEVLGGHAARKRIEAFVPKDLGLTQDEYDALSADDRQERVQEWVSDVEVEAELEFNPIHRRTSELAGLADHPPHGEMGLMRPEPPPDASFEDRLEAINNATHEGGRAWIRIEGGPQIQRDVWLPRFDLPGYSGLSIAKEIAYLLALEEFIRRGARPPLASAVS